MYKLDNQTGVATQAETSWCAGGAMHRRKVPSGLRRSSHKPISRQGRTLAGRDLGDLRSTRHPARHIAEVPNSGLNTKIHHTLALPFVAGFSAVPIAVRCPEGSRDASAHGSTSQSWVASRPATSERPFGMFKLERSQSYRLDRMSVAGLRASTLSLLFFILSD